MHMHLKFLEPCVTLSTNNDTGVNLTFPCWKLLFFMPIIDYLYFRNHAVNFIKICTTYANQWVIKVALSIINSDKLSQTMTIYVWVSFLKVKVKVSILQ